MRGPLLWISPFAALWKREMVERLERQLRTEHPELYGDGFAGRLYMRPGRVELDRGMGIFVRDGVEIPEGALVGAYVGEVLDDMGGPYCFQLAAVRGHGRPEWIPVIDGRDAVYAGEEIQVAAYNHTCRRPTVRLVSFGVGPLKCKLAYATRRLRGNDELLFNYGPDYVCENGDFVALRAEFPGARMCSSSCQGGRCPCRSVLKY